MVPFYIKMLLKVLGIRASRAVQLLSDVLFLTSIWLYMLTMDLGANFKFMVRALPWWCLITLGCYALFCIGKDLIMLGDCSNASRELEQEIEQAKAKLNSQGIKTS